MQSTLAMLGTASDRLRYLTPSIQGLIRGLSAQYPQLEFLSKCNLSLQTGQPLSSAFEEAITHEPMREGTRKTLLTLAGELGRSDVDSQLAAIAYAAECLRGEIAREEKLCGVHGKLYRSLGALGGAALAILLI